MRKKIGPIGWIRRIGRICALLATALLLTATPAVRAADGSPRSSETLTTDWRTALIANPALLAPPSAEDPSWRTVEVPHNWDDYGGATGVRHGNLHGSAWYRRTFPVAPAAISPELRVFLFFEGVGSYATVWVNGREVGKHAGGLTTFTLDVTAAVHAGDDNVLLVRADHPEGIRDLPWVCGGCERVYGFSEGPQPFGIFRPVHVVFTNAVRIAPFGVHVWNDADLDPNAARVHVRTELTNHGTTAATFTLRSRIVPASSDLRSPPSAIPVAAEVSAAVTLAAGETKTIASEPPPVTDARLWSLNDPFRYALVTELVAASGTVLDREETLFGLRTIRWPDPKDPKADGRFFLNNEPVFLNGTCDYEHNLGANFAFTNEQVDARVSQIRAAGFNAFRDAHHPHNLRFNEHWDREGVAWWTQMGAQIWFDSDVFRANFRTLLRDWVKERRNSPSLVLWGLQNESKLPEAFAAECTALIRELDPTSPTQRLVTTCNGGKGTDWDVPQNWTGTYGGDPTKYAEDLKHQRLIGEYGAWRSLGLHDERGYKLEGPLGEERFATLMEMKVRLGEAARDFSAGHFQWIFTTHANPGRAVGENGEQLFDGIEPHDQVGLANNKGLFTQWGEPTDAYYMYRANYVSAAKEPMVYLVSPTWNDRWKKPGVVPSIVAYSNCEEVELFAFPGGPSLGVRQRGNSGTFRWENVKVQYDLLHVEGHAGGKTVATHTINPARDLPPAPRSFASRQSDDDAAAPRPGWHYIYRVNCGGPEWGNRDTTWSFDHPWFAELAAGADPRALPGTGTYGPWGSVSWGNDFAHVSPLTGSRRTIHVPIQGTLAQGLFQSFRYGREKLRYIFPLPDGEYQVELLFVEPWYGQGGTDATGWRVFDVAINGVTAIHDLDIFREVGFARALRKIVPVHVEHGQITVSFPRIEAGQAVIAGIAIASRNQLGSATAGRIKKPDSHLLSPSLVSPLRPKLIQDLAKATEPITGGSLQIGHLVNVSDEVIRLSVALADSDWIKPTPWEKPFAIEFTPKTQVEIYGAFKTNPPPGWIAATPRITVRYTGDVKGKETTFVLHKRRASAGDRVSLPADLVSSATLFLVQAVRPPVVVPLERETDGSPAWTISVGVGDRYGLNFQYRNTSGAPVKATLAIVQSDGTTLRTDPLEFPASAGATGAANDAWSTLRARTGSSINAGTYRLKLTVAPETKPEAAAALKLGALEIE